MNALLNKKAFVTIAVILLAIFAWMFFYKLGSRPLLDYDEGIYAQVSKEALQNHQPFIFTWKGNIGLNRPGLWFEKPPLMIWLTEASFKIFGTNEFAARFPAAVFAFLTVLLTGLVAYRMFGSKITSLFSLAAFFAAFQFIYNADVLQFDIPVGFFILLSLWAFYETKKNPKWWYLFWAGLAFGVMTKSVIGLLPLPIIGLYSLIKLDFHFLKIKNLWLGFILFIILVAPWHIYESIKFGHLFWDQYLFYHVIERFKTPLEGNERPFLFYWNELLQQRLLIFLSLIGTAYSVAASFQKKFNYLLLTIAAIFILLFFSLAQTKLLAYILVIYPYLCIISGTLLDKIIKRIQSYNIKAAQLVVFICLSGLAAIGLKYNSYRLLEANDLILIDSKTIGLFLYNYPGNQKIYYASDAGTKPNIIFYSNKIVYFLPSHALLPTNSLIIADNPIFVVGTAILTTFTKTLYLTP